MSDPNIIDPEYNEFLKVFNGCWPTNYEFFLAACNWQKQKQEKVHGEPVGVVKTKYVEFNGDYTYAEWLRPVVEGTLLYTSAPKQKESK